MQLPYDPAIPLTDIHLGKMKSKSKDLYLNTHSFVIAPNWEEAKCPPTDERISKLDKRDPYTGSTLLRDKINVCSFTGWKMYMPAPWFWCSNNSHNVYSENIFNSFSLGVNHLADHFIPMIFLFFVII